MIMDLTLHPEFVKCDHMGFHINDPTTKNKWKTATLRDENIHRIYSSDLTQIGQANSRD